MGRNVVIAASSYYVLPEFAAFSLRPAISPLVDRNYELGGISLGTRESWLRLLSKLNSPLFVASEHLGKYGCRQCVNLTRSCGTNAAHLPHLILYAIKPAL